MDTLIVYPQNKEQLTALKAVMKAIKISFQLKNEKNEAYPGYVINGVKESLAEANEGKLTEYTGIKDMLGLA